MNTTTAAAQAGVAVATIRTWCRRGIIAATKTAGRWDIDSISLTRRITIGALRARKAKPVTNPTGKIVQMRTGYYGVRGDAATLAAAYETGTPITPTNAPYAQDKVFLGLTRETLGDYGRTQETVGLAYTTDDGDAVYYLDTNNFSQCPAFADAYDEAIETSMDLHAAADAADREYFNPRYM